MTCEEEPAPSDALGTSCHELSPPTPRQQHLVTLSQLPPELFHRAGHLEPVLSGMLLACPHRWGPHGWLPTQSHQHEVSSRVDSAARHLRKGTAHHNPITLSPARRLFWLHPPQPDQLSIMCCHHPCASTFITLPGKTLVKRCFPWKLSDAPLNPILLLTAAPGSRTKGKLHSLAAPLDGDGFRSPNISSSSIQARNSAHFLRGKGWGSTFGCHAEPRLGP